MLTPSVTLVRVFDRTWEAWLHGVERCRRKPSRRAVHALRLDCRRLEALIEVLGYTTAASPKALHRLATKTAKPFDALSTLRDDQVQRRRIARTADGDRLDALLEDVRDRERRHQKRARRALVAVDVARIDAAAQRVRKAVVRHQGAPTRGELTRLLLAAMDGAGSEVAGRLTRLDARRPRTLHKLRIAVKHLRYIMEIAQEISPAVHVASQPTLQSLQRRLGVVHDADVLLARIDRAGRRRTNREPMRAFRETLEAERGRNLRAISRLLPALRHALTDLAAHASSGAAARAL